MEKIYLIDTHAHLIDEKYEDSEVVLAQAREAGAGKIVVPTTEIEGWVPAVEFAEKNEGVYVLLGVHPEHTEQGFDEKEYGRAIEEMLGDDRSEKIVGIGEIGLDFYYDKEKKTREVQIRAFEAQMNIAVKYHLPVAIHMREAEEEMEECLKKYIGKVGIQFHCYGGSGEFLARRVREGCYVSFAGNVTFKNAEELRARLSEVPLSQLLLETDAPYLAPMPVRGSLNTPANVKIIAEFVSSYLSIPFEKLAEETTKNAICLYGLGN